MTLYFNEYKSRPVGERLVGGKLLKKTHKSIEQLKRHDPDVVVSKDPSQFLFVSNSSVVCGVSLEELEEIFRPFDENCEFIVYPNKRAYSFVSFTSVEKASSAFSELNGLVHPSLIVSHLPFVIAYVNNLPVAKASDGILRPKDLHVEEEFITEDEERELLNLIMDNPKLDRLKHRGVLHFGHEFDYSSNTSFKRCDPIPENIMNIIRKVMDRGFCLFEPDQITVNLYNPGQGIPSHYDTHSAFEDPVVSLSLMSDVVMEFKDGANSARVAGVLLKRRSLCVIQGESRYRWKHGIVNRKHDVDPLSNRVVPRQMRVSLTLRKIRREPCQCEYKEFCDWDRNGEMSVPHEASAARRLESAYVTDVYENIASHFDETRHSNWRAVQKFIDSLPPYSVMYDIGCGNGKYLVTNDKLIKMGCDMCMGLCSIGFRKGCHVVRADGLSIPFKAGADASICIAVLHHFSSLERRIQLVREILRVLKPGGRVCITVWNMDQTGAEYAKMRANKIECIREENEKDEGRIKVHDGKDFVQQDVLVPWQIEGGNGDKKGETFLRFYHVFLQGEMESLIELVGGCSLESIENEQGNWIAIVKKDG